MKKWLLQLILVFLLSTLSANSSYRIVPKLLPPIPIPSMNVISKKSAFLFFIPYAYASPSEEDVWTNYAAAMQAWLDHEEVRTNVGIQKERSDLESLVNSPSRDQNKLMSAYVGLLEKLYGPQHKLSEAAREYHTQLKNDESKALGTYGKLVQHYTAELEKHPSTHSVAENLKGINDLCHKFSQERSHSDTRRRLLNKMSKFYEGYTKAVTPSKSAHPTHEQEEVKADTETIIADLEELNKPNTGAPHDCGDAEVPSHGSKPMEKPDLLPVPIAHLSEIAQKCSQFVFEDPQNVNQPLFGGKLSPLWAQKNVGFDLAIKALESESTSTVPVGVLDSDFNIQAFPNDQVPSESIKGDLNDSAAHGTKVVNLIASKDPPVGASHVAKVHAAACPYNSDTLRRLEEFSESDVRVINMSRGAEFHIDAMFGQFREISNRKVMVNSAGNDYPSPIDPRFKSLDNVILVGNLAASGLMNVTSSSGSEVTIAAPSDFYIQSVADGSRKLTSFAGTSGATPLVTGAVANVMSLLPKLSPEATKYLVVQSAIPAANSYEKPRMNGAGVINPLKLVEVAKKLSKDPDWKKLDATQQIAYLKNHHDKIFKFDVEAENHLNEGIQKLKHFGVQKSCTNLKEAFDSLRKAYLLAPLQNPGLNPVFRSAAENLKNIAHSSGRTVDSLYFESLMYPEGTQEVVRKVGKEEYLQRPESAGSVARSLGHLPKDEAIAYISELAGRVKGVHSFFAIKQASRDLGVPQLLPKFQAGALQAAIQNKFNSGSIQMILEEGIKPIQNEFSTALENGSHVSVLTLLAQYGADPNQYNLRGYTPATAIAARILRPGYKELFKALFDKIDFSQKTRDGRSLSLDDILSLSLSNDDVLLEQVRDKVRQANEIKSK